MNNRKRQLSVLALVAGLAGPEAWAQATLVLAQPPQPNQEPQSGPATGFALSLDGVRIEGDPQVEDRVRRVDAALAAADVRVQVNTLDPTPRLDVEIAGPPRSHRAGERVTLMSETNYPAFILRAEMRLIDRGAPGGARLLSQVPVQPNGRVTLVVPEGRDVVAVHRVYDATGRYDETRALSLTRPDARGQSDAAEEGTPFAARRAIRVTGGAVTVSASGMAPGAAMTTLGETVRPDATGRAVIERILPAGTHMVDVTIGGAGRGVSTTRPVEIPSSEWFHVAVTLGRYRDGASGKTDTRTTGRLQVFVDGRTLDGIEVTSSLDTGEEELRDIFRRLDGRDPRDVIRQMDAGDGYPTYGDDSTLVDTTPTSGKFYLRGQKEKSFLLWGDFSSALDGNGLVRDERSLYGAQVHVETPATTGRGEPIATLDLHASEPDQVVGRDVFRGTGGSVYFLRQQAVTAGSASVTVEIRDAGTGRVVERRRLIEGRDFRINELQGIVVLTRPLTGALDRNLIRTEPGGDETVSLVVQYEYTPVLGGVDGMAWGGRLETWLGDCIRLGTIAIVDDTGPADQRNFGSDLRYELGDNSFVQLDVARSEGPGFDRFASRDGGLDFRTATGGAGEGMR